MAKKSKKKNWDDVKMVISALSVTATLAMWNIFAANTPKENTQVVELLPEPEPVVVIEPTAIPTQPAFTGKILLGGEAPKPRVVVVHTSGSGGGGGGGGGGGSGGAVTATASS